MEPPVETIPDYRDEQPVRASIETALSGENNDSRWEWWMPGTSGNGKTLTGTFTEDYPALTVATTGSPVTGVVITGPANTTLNQVLAAVQHTPSVSALVSVATKHGNNGTGTMVTFAVLTFAGGVGTPPSSPVKTILP